MTLLRAGLTNGKTIDIVGYDIMLGKFDCSDNTTKVFDDFEYFIMPKDELKEIGEKLNSYNEKRNKVSKNANTEKQNQE